MTRIGIITPYQRILYSSAVKKDLFKPSRPYSSSSNSSSTGGSEEKDPKQNANLRKFREENQKKFDLKTGEIGQKVEFVKINLEDAKKLALAQYENQRKILDEKLESVKAIFGAGGLQPRTPDEEWYHKRVSFWMQRYENFVGLTDVKAAQARVVKYEKKFIDTQEIRREAQSKITDVQKKIKDIHLELEKTFRGEDRYLVLVTQEHQVLKEEKELQEEFKLLEKTERECFSALSNAVRDSHEKERAQAEKTKYWSVLGSILGTCIGIFGTTINNRMRMNELRRLVSQNNAVEEIKEIGDNLTADFSSHRSSLAGLVTAVEGVVSKAEGSVGNLEKMEELCEVVRGASEKINVRSLDASLETLRRQQEALNTAITEHREQVDTRVGEILTDIFDQKRQMQEINSLAVKDRESDHKQMDKREADFRATSDSLNQKSAELRETIMNSVKVIDDKMKDVRSLLLHQSQVPKETEKLIEKLERLEKTQLLLVQRGFENVITKLDEAAETRRQAMSVMRIQQRQQQSQLQQQGNSEALMMEYDNMSLLMQENQEKTQQAVVLTGLVVGVLTPLVITAINKFM